MKKPIYFLLVLFVGYTNFLIAQSNYSREGIASFYADKFEGRKTANGEIYLHSKHTAAHLTLPFGTIVRVTNSANQKSIDVKINDRGPFIQNRIIDLSKSAAQQLQFLDSGLANVKIEVIKEAPLPVKKKKIALKTLQCNVSTSGTKKTDEKKSTSHGIGIQIGSFTKYDNTIRISKELKDIYKQPITIKTAKINNTNIYRVIVGNFAKKPEAAELKEKLITKFPDCYIVTF